MISKQVFNRMVYFYTVPYLVLLTVVLGMLYMYPKIELHLLLNSYHTSFLDTFFKHYTVLAEWPLYIVALLPLLWKKGKITLYYAISEVAGGIFVQLLKHLFSSDRPVSVFENSHLVLPLVQGVEMHHSNSFPSGHSSTFFMFFTCCAIVLAYYFSKDNKPHTLRTRILFNASQLLLLLLAALGAYSRVYLSQHFLSDICVGSIIGFTTPFLMFYFCERKLLKSKNKEIK